MLYNMRKINLLSVLLFAAAMLCVSPAATAQDVSNVDAFQQGKSIAVTYDLKTPSRISLFYTLDGGQTMIPIPKQYLSGDVGVRVAAGPGKKILWQVLEQNHNQDFSSENMSFIVESRMSPRLFVMANAGYSLDSGPTAGLAIGQIAAIGWYVKAMTTLSMPRQTEFECDASGYIDGVLPLYSGESAKSKFYGVAGAVFRVAGPFCLNAAIGYGSRSYAWELQDGRWASHKGASYSGLALDAGMMTYFDKVVLSAAATMIGGKIDFNIGVGYLF